MLTIAGGTIRSVLLVVFLAFSLGCASTEKKYAKTTTVELKLRRQQCVDELNAGQGRFSFRFGGPWWAHGDDRKDVTKEKNKIENELLRRFKAGDQEAFLPVFQ